MKRVRSASDNEIDDECPFDAPSDSSQLRIEEFDLAEDDKNQEPPDKAAKPPAIVNIFSKKRKVAGFDKHQTSSLGSEQVDGDAKAEEDCPFAAEPFWKAHLSTDPSLSQIQQVPLCFRIPPLPTIRVFSLLTLSS